MKNRTVFALLIVGGIIAAFAGSALVIGFAGGRTAQSSGFQLLRQSAGLYARLHGAEPKKPAPVPSQAAVKTPEAASSGEQSSAPSVPAAPSVPSVPSIPSAPAAPLVPAAPADGQKRIAFLTFDDGPSKVTAHLLDLLKARRVKATFFVIANSKDTPYRRALIKREAKEGHTVGIHSFTHDYDRIYKSESDFMYDFIRMRDMIVDACGVAPKYMRFPGGTDNTVSIRVHDYTPIMPQLLVDVLSKGYIPVDWNVSGGDAVIPVPGEKSIANSVVSQCRKLHTAVILLHDSATHESSADAVPEIIARLSAMGFTFEPMTTQTQLCRHKPAQKYRK